MNQDGLVGLAMFAGFGIWWVIWPGSVIRLYTWLHKGQVRLPRALVIRVVGLGWAVFVAIIFIIALRKK